MKNSLSLKALLLSGILMLGTLPFVTGQASADEIAATDSSTTQSTEWKDKFADHFTDEVVISDHSYSSPDISISIERWEGEKYGINRIYYVADIYVSSIDCLRTYTKENRLFAGQEGLTDIALMDVEANALLSTNADDYSIQPGKMFYRNGVLVDGKCLGSVCVLYNDGVMETYNSKAFDYEANKDRGIWQLWSFGPPLLDADGHAMEESTLDLPSYTIEGDAPRTVIGYYEPGHYCLLVSEGRSDSCRGFRTGQLAQLCEELGLAQAYNLDGGRSSTMIFEHDQLNTRSNGGSAIADIICIVEPDMLVDGPLS